MKNQITSKFNKLSEAKKQEFLLQLQNRGEKYGIFPLSNLQKSLLFSYLTMKEDTSYHIRFLIHFSKELDVRRLEKAVHQLLYRNTSLRTQLLVVRDEYFQMVQRCEEISLPVVNRERLQDVYEDLLVSRTRYFDLENEIPIRFCLYRVVEDGEYLLSVCIHHMFCDGWSVDLLSKELKNAYMALEQSGNEENTAPKKEYYKCFKVDERAECLRFWDNYLMNCRMKLNFPGSTFVEDHMQAVKKTYVSALAGKEELERIAKSYAVSSYCLTVGVYILALHQWCKQQRIGIGIATLNRHDSDEFENIGLYANTLPMVDTYDERLGMQEFYQKLRGELNAILDYSGVDADYIMKKLDISNNGENNAMYQTVFLISEKSREKEPLSNGWMYLENIDNSNRIQFDLICCLEKEQNLYSIRLDYRDLLFKEADIQAFANIYSKTFMMVKEHRQISLDLQCNSVEQLQQAMPGDNGVPMELPGSQSSAEYDIVAGQIRAAWETILGSRDFSSDDNFFTIGGNSLLCIKMVSKLNAVLERKIKVTDIFKYDTIRKLAEFLTNSSQKERINMIRM